jgi:molybdopterin molybdotransferase
MLGGLYGGQERIGDDYCDWIEALKSPAPGQEGDLMECAPPAHVAITTGGTGPSGNDHLRKAVAELGGRLLIDGVAMRPGHPTVLAVLPDGRFIIGLPGNPLAAMRLS